MGVLPQENIEGTIGSTAGTVNKDRYIILVIVLIGIFMAVLDGSVVNIALPTITSFFGVDVAQSQWVMTSYLIAMTSLLLIFGRISEYIGRSKLFFIGFAIFTLGSLACGISHSLDGLIFFRIVQAIGASMVFSISTAIIFQAFPKRERGRALGYIGTTVALGGITGPVLGGLIVDALGWEYIFLINVPIGIALLAIAFKYLKLNDNRSASLNMDWYGAVALVLSVVSLMMFFGDLAACRTISTNMILYAGVFLLSVTGFMKLESGHKYPIIDLSIFRVRRFTFANFATLISFIAIFAFNFVMPFYLEMIMGYSPSRVGQILIIIPIVVSVVAPLSGWLYDKFESGYHSSIGMLIMAISLILLGIFISASSFMILAACFVAIGIGNGLFQSPNNNEVMSALPPHKSSTASSTLATVRNLGMAMGVSFASILLSIQLNACGFNGPVVGAAPAILSQAISGVLLAAGMLCLAGAGMSLLKGRERV